MGPRVLVIDNYDSFVYNLVQELGELGAEPVVFRNDAIDVAGIRAERPDAVLISPGPGRPEDGGVSLEAIADARPARSRCSGSAWATSASARPSAARSWRPPTSCTARPRRSTTTGRASSPACPTPSWPPATTPWSCGPTRCPTELEVTATSTDGVIMGLRHRSLAVEGVQFHPESVLTASGPALLANFLGPARPAAA